MSPSSLAKVISMAIRNRRPLLIKGAPGIGKSDIVAQACNEAGAKLIIEHPVVSDPTDFKGLPFPSADGQSAHFLPFGSLLEILKYDDETKEKEREVIVYFIDDLGQAPPAVQAACFPAGTKVSVPNGTANIEDLKVGDTIIDGYGVKQTVTCTFVNNTDKLVNINAVGILPIVSTEDHPILVSSGRKRSYKKGSDGKYNVSSVKYGEAKWVNASMVKANDYIALPIPKPYISNPELPISTNGIVKRTMPLTEELAELCGYYVGDGWYTQHKSIQSIGFALDNKYPEIQERLIYLIEKVFGAKAFVQAYKSHKRIHFHDKEIGEFFHANFGNRANNKHVPEWIVFNEDINIVTSFIKGYYYTDGADLRSSGVRRGIQFSTVSKTLAIQVQQMILRYNTVAPIKYHCRNRQVMKCPRSGKEYKVQDAYVIQCSSKSLLDAMGIDYDNKRDINWSYEHDGMMWTRVKSLSYVDTKCDTYNIEVTGSNTYSVNNVCVHNCMQLILARRINGFRVSDKVVFIAATNRKADKAGVTGILEPVKSRFASIIELEVSVDDWISWAIDNKMPSELLAFIRFRGEKMLHDFHPTADIQNSPSPRTVTNVGYLMRDGIPNELRFEIFSGAAGEGWAGEFMGFLKLYENLPTIESIIKDPDNAPIFSEPSLNFAVTSSLASKANAQNFDTIMKYGKRMPKEFQVLLVKDSVKHNRKVSDTKAFMDWALANSGVIL